MIPYVIICRSCSAKLKVSVVELIGETINCPKCNTELTLTPPAGYQRPSEANDDAGDSTTNRFDDLDDLLGRVQKQSTPPQPAKKNADSKPVTSVTSVKRLEKPAAKMPAGDATEEIARKLDQTVPQPKQQRNNAGEHSLESQASEPAAMDGPLLPDGSWDSDALKKRKRLIQFGSFGILGVLLAAVGVFFIAGGNGTESEPSSFIESSTAQNADEDTDGEKLETAQVEPSREFEQSSVEGDAAPPRVTSVTDLGGGDASAVRSAADFAAPVIGDSGFGVPTTRQSASPLHLSTDTSQPEGAQAIASVERVNTPSTVEDPLNVPSNETNAGKFFAKETPKKSPLVPNKRSLSEFARALEEAGTVLSEIKDQALLRRDSALIGLPKYFVEPLDEEPVEVSRQLAVSVSGVQFVDSSVLDVLFELESLSGLPVAFDWDSETVRATDFSQKISLKTRDENFESLFATVAEKVGLKVIGSDRGLLITRGEVSEESEHKWKLSPALSDALVKELKGFIVRTWPLGFFEGDADEAAARKELAKSVSVTSDQVSLSCDADLYSRLDALIAGMTAAAEPESATLTMADSSVTPTVFSVDRILERPLELASDNPFRRPYRIGSLLRQIRQQTGLSIFMDWPSLQALGWSPNASIPGSFNEANCRDALEQLARSLKASWIVINEKTVLLTSFETANGKSETEVYPVKFLLQKNLTSGELKRVLEDTLGQQLQMPDVSVVYFGQYDCLIAHAPQSVHRQLYSILNRLWQDLK